MALQNIGAGNRDDAFYRYKMPKMLTKIEGRGNGIKTNIVNMVDIAKALARPRLTQQSTLVVNLGAQSKFDEKTGVSLVNGSHDTAKLAGLLENFIQKYVQCYGCGNPETEIIITKAQMITLKCAACGFVSDVDMRAKLTTFILKNPPEVKKASKDKKAMRRAEKERLKEGEAADEELKKIKKEIKKKGTASSKDVAASKTSTAKKANGSGEDHSSPAGSQAGDNEMTEEDDEDVQWQTDTSMEAARQRIQEQLNAATAEMVMLSTDTDNKKNPKQANEEDLRLVTKEVGGNPSDHEKLVGMIKTNLKGGSTPRELASFLASLSGTPQQLMDALFEALFNGIGKGFAKEVAKKKKYLAAAVQGESQMHLLCAMEAFCGKAGGDVVKEIALAVKALYDEDVLEEECIVQWYNEGLSGGNKASVIWKNMKAFIEWIQTAESESEEE